MPVTRERPAAALEKDGMTLLYAAARRGWDTSQRAQVFLEPGEAAGHGLATMIGVGDAMIGTGNDEEVARLVRSRAKR